MLLNGMVLKDLNELQTIHQIAKKLLFKGDNFVSGGSSGVCTVLHTGILSLNPTLILCETHVIRCSPIEVTKVRCQYGLLNT